MFVRSKQNSSGSVSIQVIRKRDGKNTVVKTIGCTNNESELNALIQKAKHFIEQIEGKQRLDFINHDQSELFAKFVNSINKMHLVGPDLVFGKIFDEIGFNQIKDDLFRHLVISRLFQPVSKLKTVEYLSRYKGIVIDISKVYRYLDKLYNTQKSLIEQISYEHSKKITGQQPQVVFYDVTTIYFETDNQDELRRSGFSKEGRHSNPQILLALLVNQDGYPLAYEIFEGNKYEGHTMLPVIEAFKKKYKLSKLVIVADSGLISRKNISDLERLGYDYIIGERIKNKETIIMEKILALQLKDGEASEIYIKDTERLIVSYSAKRASKDEYNRAKGLEKLSKRIKSSKLTKSSINNKGYNKFLKMDGEIRLTIDQSKLEDDKKWDGLKGYLTNTKISKHEVLRQYNNLWRIEQAFRISKTDIKIRPIYHRLRRRIEAHICISFCAYKIYKELERKLTLSNSKLSVLNAIDIANSIYKIIFTNPFSNQSIEKIILNNDDQHELINLIHSPLWVPQ